MLSYLYEITKIPTYYRISYNDLFPIRVHYKILSRCLNYLANCS